MLPQNNAFFKVQARVIGALLMREIVIRYGRNNIGFLWIIVEPMMFTLGITTLWILIDATHGSNLPITAFALTGYSSMLIWRNPVGRCTLAIRSNRSLLQHRFIRVLHLFLARILLEISSITMSLFVLSVLFINMGLMEFPDNILNIFIGWLLQAWFGTSLALFVGVLSEFSEAAERIWNTLAYLLFPASGAGFLVDWLPKQAQDIVLWLPMVNGGELIRDGFFGDTVRTYYSIPYMIFFCSILSMLSLAMVRETEKNVGQG